MSDIQTHEILHYPFNEPAGTSGEDQGTIHDYSASGVSTVLKGTAEVVFGGKKGNCLRIGGDGGNTQTAFTLDPTSNYTIAMWTRRDPTPDGVTFAADAVSVFFHAPNADNTVEHSYNLTVDWMHIAVVKNGLKVKVYIGGRQVDAFTLTEQPDYVLILQDGSSEDMTYASIDDLFVYDAALTEEDIRSIVDGTTHRLRYIIGGVDVRERYGVCFDKSQGLLSRPKTKTSEKVDWPGYHGDVVDLKSKRVEARTITLKGWMPAKNKNDFVSKWNDFVQMFDSDDTLRLHVDIDPTRPLVYEVYLEDSMDADKRWSDSDMVGTFTLKLREPDPVKRVVRQLVTTSSASRNLTIQMTSQKAVTIYWGDGTKDEDLSGTISKTHQYPEGTATYYAIIGGVVEEITNFSTTGIVVWNRL